MALTQIRVTRRTAAPARPFSAQRDDSKGHVYYEFEFTAKTPRYTRHSVAVVSVDNGKFYTLSTGSNERRWGKMKDKLNTVVRSFQFVN